MLRLGQSGEGVQGCSSYHLYVCHFSVFEIISKWKVIHQKTSSDLIELAFIKFTKRLGINWTHILKWKLLGHLTKHILMCLHFWYHFLVPSLHDRMGIFNQRSGGPPSVPHFFMGLSTSHPILFHMVIFPISGFQQSGSKQDSGNLLSI